MLWLTHDYIIEKDNIKHMFPAYPEKCQLHNQSIVPTPELVDESEIDFLSDNLDEYLKVKNNFPYSGIQLNEDTSKLCSVCRQQLLNWLSERGYVK
ncbi:MAG: hypothetical protein D3923_04855 [Candidatus Electrothrix sp. AR3]|nr:hypothetical protein [Candidatus Electrothrix sp. AR3]